MIELTAEEVRFLLYVLNNTPLTARRAEMARVLAMVEAIIKKLEAYSDTAERADARSPS